MMIARIDMVLMIVMTTTIRMTMLMKLKTIWPIITSAPSIFKHHSITVTAMGFGFTDFFFRSSSTELKYLDPSEGADKDENYSKIDMSGLMCRQQYLSAGRRNIQFHLHIFQNILSRPFCAIFSPALRNCSHLAFCKTQITFRKWVPEQDMPEQSNIFVEDLDFEQDSWCLV